MNVIFNLFYEHLFQPVMDDKPVNGKLRNGTKTSDYTNEYSAVYSSCYSNGVNNGYMTATTKQTTNETVNGESRKIK